MNLFKRAAAAAAFLVLAGCFADPKPIIDEFTWESVTRQSDIMEGVSIAALFRDISFLGQVKTPTLCYNVGSRLTVAGTVLTLNIDITNSGSGTCAQQAGGVRYTGVVRNLAHGTYTVRIIQTVGGIGTQEFTEEVTL